MSNSVVDDKEQLKLGFELARKGSILKLHLIDCTGIKQFKKSCGDDE